MRTIFTVFYLIIKGTPVFVWILLAYLVSRGLNASKTKPLNLLKMLIMPIVFMSWGLDKIFMHFSNLGLVFFFYALFGIIGTGVGYSLYRKVRKIFYENNTYYCTGSYLPLSIILTNFSIKYVLSVLLTIRPLLYTSTPFCLLYSALSGFSIGLFFGGWFQAYKAYKKLLIQTNACAGKYEKA